jgi:hypothetical protein
MSNEILPRPGPGRGRAHGRPFELGQSGNPGGRRPRFRNKATLAAAVLLGGEPEGLTRKAVAAAVGGDMFAMKLCRELPVRLHLPLIATAAHGEIGECRCRMCGEQ